jgi:hypothetical protein
MPPVFQYYLCGAELCQTDRYSVSGSVSGIQRHGYEVKQRRRSFQVKVYVGTNF